MARHPYVVLILLHVPVDMLPDPLKSIRGEGSPTGGVELLHGSAEAYHAHLKEVALIVATLTHTSLHYQCPIAAAQSVIYEANVVFD